MRAAFFIFLVLFFPFIVKAQKASDDIIKINKALEKANSISMEMTYSVFPNHQSSVPTSVVKGNYKKMGIEYMTNLSGIVTLQNKNYQVSIDPESRNMVVAFPSKDKNPYTIMNIDTLLSESSSVKSELIDKDSKRIRMLFTEEQEEEEDEVAIFERVDVIFNTNTFFFEKLIFYYGESMSLDEEEKSPEQKPRLEVKFEKVTINPSFQANAFSEKQFFSLQGKKLICAQGYKDFKIFDQRIKR